MGASTSLGVPGLRVRPLPAYDPRHVRPATAIILLILLVLIAVTGLIQLWVLFSPPG